MPSTSSGETCEAGQFSTDAEDMRKIALILAAVLVVVILAGLALLGTIDIPPPTKTIEMNLPNDRLSR